MESSTKQRLEVAGVVIAVLGAITSLYFSVATRMDVRDQRQLQALDLLKARNERIEKWAGQLVDSMTEAVFLCTLPEVDRIAKRPPLLTRLSSLIDQGRFIIPNESPEAFGHSSPPAFRGFRPKLLDHPVALYDMVDKGECDNVDATTPLKSPRNDLRRKFVSDAQELLDPAKFNERLRQLHERLRDGG